MKRIGSSWMKLAAAGASRRRRAWLVLGAAAWLAPSASPARAQGQALPYAWSVVTDSAAFPGSYNFPVFVVHGEMWALHLEGAWRSTDANRWTRTELPKSGLNSGYQKFVMLGDAVYALGTMTGNYMDLHLTSRIVRTRDLRSWEIVAPESNLPARVFYGALTHRGRVWILGGYDGKAYYNEVWSSPDAIHWTRVLAHAPWSPRNIDGAVVFKDRLWVLGGGVIDGQREPNPNARREVWSSADGVTWIRSPDRNAAAWGGTPVTFDGRLWLVASNRNSTFAPSMMMTEDGAAWHEVSAPWSPRGAPAVWTWNGRLYVAGGKYSVQVNGRQEFIYRNDVWAMSRAP
ncbi:MAG: hypothetical protein U9Q74_03990 [Gemmatimonadota bacterium]|nr:hypothetical protein [Gemmatimonadota bacterium]